MFGILRSTISAVCCLILLCSVTAYADTHWVNPSGSNTPPYVTYATGAHKIQDAINQTIAGDTVRIVSGIYLPDTTIFLRDSIAVIGAGRDLTIIAPNRDDFLHIFELKGPLGGAGGGLTLSGCTIRGYDSPKRNIPYHDGIYIHLKKSTTNVVFGNSFHYCYAALDLSNVDIVVSDNYFDSNKVAVFIAFEGPYDIHHNTFIGWPLGLGQPSSRGVDGTIFPLLGPARIHQNMAFLNRGAGIETTNVRDSISIYNNLIVTGGGMGLFAYCDCQGAVIKNNTVIRPDADEGRPMAGFTVVPGSEMVLENNLFQGVDGVVKIYGELYGGGTMQFSYNDLWGLDSIAGHTRGLDYELDLPPDTVGNLFVDPMLTTDGTYGLQRGSPLIDAGNPSLEDLDGSRSDIGAHGGPDGITYEYPEEAPRRPDTLMGETSGEAFALTWPQSSESDLAEYRLYRDSFSPVTPQPEILLAGINLSESSYVDSAIGLPGDLFYVLTVVDTAGWESPPSNEVAISATGILEDEELSEAIPRVPYIIGNYPNPFNASTTVEYYLPNIGAWPIQVKLIVYDALGRKVTSLINKRQNPGTHHVSWNGRDDFGDPVASGMYFARLKIWGYEFESSVKIVLQK